VKDLPNIKFVFIGTTNNYFRNELNFKNVEFLGLVDNYYEVLSCSVLFRRIQHMLNI
jgi:hypothetical protein